MNQNFEWEDIPGLFFVFCFGTMFAFVLYILLIWAPISLIAESDCLQQGYPESRTDIFLNKYCMNLEGDVVVRVEKL